MPALYYRTVLSTLSTARDTASVPSPTMASTQSSEAGSTDAPTIVFGVLATVIGLISIMLAMIPILFVFKAYVRRRNSGQTQPYEMESPPIAKYVDQQVMRCCQLTLIPSWHGTIQTTYQSGDGAGARLDPRMVHMTTRSLLQAPGNCYFKEESSQTSGHVDVPWPTQ